MMEQNTVRPNVPLDGPPGAPSQTDSGGFSSIKIDAHTQVMTQMQANRAVRIHAIIAFLVTCINFLLWFFIGWATNVYPWWIFVMAGFGLSMTTHVFLIGVEKDWLQLHINFFAIINLLMFCIWIFESSYTISWNLYILFFLAIPLSIHIILKKFSLHQNKRLFIHVAIFTCLNLLCWTIWMDVKGVPFFMFTFLGLAIFLIIHYWWEVDFDNRLKLHLWLYADINVLLFFIWALTLVSIYPWWAIVTFLWGIGLAVHYWKSGGRFSLPGKTTQPPADVNNAQVQPQPQLAPPQQDFHQDQFQQQQLYPPQEPPKAPYSQL